MPSRVWRSVSIRDARRRICLGQHRSRCAEDKCRTIRHISLPVDGFAIGRINISQGAYALIGGYTTAILSTQYGVSFWLCLPLSGMVAAAVDALIGWPILRLR